MQILVGKLFCAKVLRWECAAYIDKNSKFHVAEQTELSKLAPENV